MQFYVLFFPPVPVELALGLQFRIAPLAQDLVTAHGDGIGEVQRPRLIDHRDAHAAVGIPHQHVLGDAAGLFAEDDIRAVGVARLAVRLTRLGGEEEVLPAGSLFKKVVDTVVVGDIHEVPVVQTGALQVAVGDLKAEGPHQMQPRAGGGAGAGDVAGVLGDLGLKKHDVQYFFIFQKTHLIKA